MSVAHIAVTGASGQLGQLVIDSLLQTQLAGGIRAIGRRADALSAFGERGLQTAVADYTNASALQSALTGVDRLILISSSEVGQRFAQHKNVIDAAKATGVKLIAYTSLLRADSSELELAGEHKSTEEYLRASGIPYIILRNGWYTENYTSAVQQALSVGAFSGASAAGRISSATRADFAAAAAAVTVSPESHVNKVYELAGDDSYTMRQFADAVAQVRGKPVQYNNLTQSEYHNLLTGFGLPPVAANIYAQSDDAASRGALFDDTRTLSKLIGRPTTPLSAWVAGFAA